MTISRRFGKIKLPITELYPFYFDFYIENSFLLEFDGEQHFHTRNGGWNNEENFSKTQERDKIKNDMISRGYKKENMENFFSKDGSKNISIFEK